MDKSDYMQNCSYQGEDRTP